MDTQEEKDVRSEDIETLTEVETDRKYNSVSKVDDINIDIKNEIIRYINNDKEYKLCSFYKMKEKDVSNILESKKLDVPEDVEDELNIFKNDLIKIWNNTGNQMYKLTYQNTDLPYQYCIDFNSNLIEDVVIQNTHNVSGDFIADNIKKQMEDYPLYKLDTMDLYAKNNHNTNKWSVYKIKDDYGIIDKIKREKDKGFYYDNVPDISDYFVSQLIKTSFLTASIYLTGSYIGYSISPIILFCFIFVILPYWKQNMIFYHLIRLLISRLLLIFNAFWNNHYSLEKLFETR